MYPQVIKNLVSLLSQLPAVGEKTSLKYIFTLLKWPQTDLTELAKNILELKNHTRTCSICGNLTQNETCVICNDLKRDQEIICVVAKIQDLFALENLGEYKGLYHVLNGTLNPIEDITPDKLNIKNLQERISAKNIKELILALNPDIAGETTVLYLMNILKNFPIKITRLAKGMPMGSQLEYADQTTISNALKGRTNLTIVP